MLCYPASSKPQSRTVFIGRINSGEERKYERSLLCGRSRDGKNCFQRDLATAACEPRDVRPLCSQYFKRIQCGQCYALAHMDSRILNLLMHSSELLAWPLNTVRPEFIEECSRLGFNKLSPNGISLKMYEVMT